MKLPDRLGSSPQRLDETLAIYVVSEINVHVVESVLSKYLLAKLGV